VSAAKHAEHASTGPPTQAEDLDQVVRLAWLAAIVESSDDAIVSKTLDGRILSWNSGATRIFGYEPAEVIGKPITVIIPEELHAEERRILEQLRRGEVIDHFDTTRLTKDGRRVQVSLTVSPVRDSRGTIIGASKVARDITERKRAEALLLASEQRLAAEAEQLERLNTRSTRLWRSRTLAEGLEEMLDAALDLLGAGAGAVQLRDDNGLVSVAAHRGAEGELVSGAISEQTVIADAQEEGANEPLRRVLREAGFRAVIAAPLLAADGTELGAILGLFRTVHQPAQQDLRRFSLYLRQAGDFIERVRLEEGLRSSEEALREADRRKDEFLALLAHELRNPLAPIRYALATSRKAQRSPEQRRRAEDVMERQVEHMSRLLDDLLDISRITRGNLELKKTSTELNTVIGAAIETARPLLDAKHHSLSLDLPKHPVQLDADAVRLAQAFSNLLINAAKYTNPGGNIQLLAAQDQGIAVITVRDNGIGISPEMMPQLFKLFSQPHAVAGHTEGGLGVGLALVRGLVTLHGGSVEARSEGIGRGSEFVVRLPLGLPVARQLDEEIEGSTAVLGPGLRILVVDDNRDAADTCAMVLELSGHRVQTAYNGRAALALGETFHPDAVVLDIGLPDVDGYQLAQSVRASSWGHGIALIAVTGWGQEEDRRRAMEAGFDHHLTKPIAAEKLEVLLQSLRGCAMA
jgi:PAS domain S-box-containing protein